MADKWVYPRRAPWINAVAEERLNHVFQAALYCLDKHQRPKSAWRVKNSFQLPAYNEHPEGKAEQKSGGRG